MSAMGKMSNRARNLLLAVLAMLVFAQAGPVAAQAVDPGATARQLMEQARRAGGKGTMPNAWWDVEALIRGADEQGSAANWAAVEQEARRLVNAAEFLNQMRQHKSALEALLGRYDQSLAEIGALYGVEPSPLLAGAPAAADLIERLTTASLRRQVEVDSLRVENRRLAGTVGDRAEALEAQVATQQAEISALRKKLWDTELRAGMAEADRSAAESVLTRKQQREEAIAAIRQAFGKDEAEIVVTAEGGVVLRVFALSFGVGSAELGKGQDKLVGKIADAVSRFPGAPLTIEGHTDDSGGRDANLKLSEKRAAAVARLLEKKLSLGSGAIATVGLGPDRPLALNSSAAGKARNRRIDLVIGAQ
jgi:outer membrane protein OmpA-like peptidoglycan-associated protein